MTTSRIEGCYAGVGARIRALRLSCGWSQAQLGSLLKPPQSRASVANIEAAKQRLLVHTAVQFARIFDVGLDGLLDGRSPVEVEKESRVESKEYDENEQFVLIRANAAGDVSVDVLDRGKLLERLNSGYYGALKFHAGPPPSDTVTWGGRALLVRGKVFLPLAVKVVEKYSL